MLETMGLNGYLLCESWEAHRTWGILPLWGRASYRWLYTQGSTIHPLIEMLANTICHIYGMRFCLTSQNLN